MDNQEKIKINILAEGAEDFVGFWLIWSQVEDILRISNPEEARAETLKLIREWIEEELIKPGFPIGNGPSFEPWSLPVDEAIAKMEQAWDELKGETPFTGDICWFITTDKGRQWVLDRRGYIHPRELQQ